MTMKKLVIMLIIVLSGASMKSQTINGLDVKDLDLNYIQILATSKGIFTKKVTISIDFGQENKLFSSKDDGIIKDESGKKVVFHSVIDALNFINKFGYSLHSTLLLTIGNTNVYHFIMKKGEV